MKLKMLQRCISRHMQQLQSAGADLKKQIDLCGTEVAFWLQDWRQDGQQSSQQQNGLPGSAAGTGTMAHIRNAHSVVNNFYTTTDKGWSTDGKGKGKGWTSDGKGKGKGKGFGQQKGKGKTRMPIWRDEPALKRRKLPVEQEKVSQPQDPEEDSDVVILDSIFEDTKRRGGRPEANQTAPGTGGCDPLDHYFMILLSLQKHHLQNLQNQEKLHSSWQLIGRSQHLKKLALLWQLKVKLQCQPHQSLILEHGDQVHHLQPTLFCIPFFLPPGVWIQVCGFKILGPSLWVQDLYLLPVRCLDISQVPSTTLQSSWVPLHLCLVRGWRADLGKKLGDICGTSQPNLGSLSPQFPLNPPRAFRDSMLESVLRPPPSQRLSLSK